MKTNLAYIDDRVNALVAREMEEPTPHSRHSKEALRPRLIAGFEVNDPNRLRSMMDEAKEARRAVLRSYLDAKRLLTEEMSDHGVVPLAVVPTHTFKRICAEADMYFVPRSLRTNVNPNAFLNWYMEQQPNPNVGRPTQMLASVSSRRISGKKQVRTVEEYLELTPHEVVMKALLTRDVQAGLPWWSSRVDGDKFDLVLPVPPEDVCETLLRGAEAGFDLQTVAVYGAVDFADGGVQGVLHRVLDQLNETLAIEEQRRIDWALNDPIVYVQRGGVTAVAAQFGPFPIELDIVERLSATDFLPVS